MFLFPGLSETILDLRVHRKEVSPDLRAELRQKTEGIMLFFICARVAVRMRVHHLYTLNEFFHRRSKKETCS
jgi:hypothetical protein